jgi:hypothetical protein
MKSWRFNKLNRCFTVSYFIKQLPNGFPCGIVSSMHLACCSTFGKSRNIPRAWMTLSCAENHLVFFYCKLLYVYIALNSKRTGTLQRYSRLIPHPSPVYTKRGTMRDYGGGRAWFNQCELHICLEWELKSEAKDGATGRQFQSLSIVFAAQPARIVAKFRILTLI